MVKLLKRSSVSLHFENTKVNRWTKATNASPVSIQETKISSLTKTKDNIFLKRKMTERMASGWMTVWRLDTELKRFRKDAVRWWKQRYNLGAISPRKAKKYKIEALKEA